MEGTSHRERYQLSFSDENPMNYKINMPIKMHLLMLSLLSFMVVINPVKNPGLSKSFALGRKVYVVNQCYRSNKIIISK